MAVPSTSPEDWATKEKFILSCCVSRSGDQNWVSVSRTMKLIAEACGDGEKRTPEWFSQKNCATKYNQLLNTAFASKRKVRGQNSESINVETPAEQILRKLTFNRIEELDQAIKAERTRYKKLKSDIEKIQSGLIDDQLPQIWSAIQNGQKVMLEQVIKTAEPELLAVKTTAQASNVPSVSSQAIASRPQRATKETEKFKSYIEQRQKHNAKYHHHTPSGSSTTTNCPASATITLSPDLSAVTGAASTAVGPSPAQVQSMMTRHESSSLVPAKGLLMTKVDQLVQQQPLYQSQIEHQQSIQQTISQHDQQMEINQQLQQKTKQQQQIQQQQQLQQQQLQQQLQHQQLQKQQQQILQQQLQQQQLKQQQQQQQIQQQQQLQRQQQQQQQQEHELQQKKLLQEQQRQQLLQQQQQQEQQKKLAQQQEQQKKLAQQQEQQKLAEIEQEKKLALQREQEKIAQQQLEQQKILQQQEEQKLAEIEHQQKLAQQREQQKIAQQLEQEKIAQQQERQKLAEQQEQQRLAEIEQEKKLAQQREQEKIAQQLLEQQKILQQQEEQKLAEIEEEKKLAQQREQQKIAQQLEQQKIAQQLEQQKIAEQQEQQKIAEQQEQLKIAQQQQLLQQQKQKQEREEEQQREQQQKLLEKQQQLKKQQLLQKQQQLEMEYKQQLELHQKQQKQKLQKKQQLQKQKELEKKKRAEMEAAILEAGEEEEKEDEENEGMCDEEDRQHTRRSQEKEEHDSEQTGGTMQGVADEKQEIKSSDTKESSYLSSLLTTPATEIKAQVNQITEVLKEPIKNPHHVTKESYAAYKKAQPPSPSSKAPVLSKLLESSISPVGNTSISMPSPVKLDSKDLQGTQSSITHFFSPTGEEEKSKKSGHRMNYPIFRRNSSDIDSPTEIKKSPSKGEIDLKMFPIVSSFFNSSTESTPSEEAFSITSPSKKEKATVKSPLKSPSLKSKLEEIEAKSDMALEKVYEEKGRLQSTLTVDVGEMSDIKIDARDTSDTHASKRRSSGTLLEVVPTKRAVEPLDVPTSPGGVETLTEAAADISEAASVFSPKFKKKKGGRRGKKKEKAPTTPMKIDILADVAPDHVNVVDAVLKADICEDDRKMKTPLTPSLPSPASPALSTGSNCDPETAHQQRSWRKSIMLVWKASASHKYANIFLHSVTDEEAPGYSSIIYRPMDLSLIKRNIETGAITTTSEFQRDIMLMFQNALMYNRKEHDVYQMAQEMRDDVMEQIQSYISAQMMVQTTDRDSKILRGKLEGSISAGHTRHTSKSGFSFLSL